MLDITVIVPVYQVNDKLKEYYGRALSSVPSDNPELSVLIVGPKAVIKEYEGVATEYQGRISFVENEKSDFATQINVGVKNCGTEFFSILEVDDAYTPIWFKNAKEHIEAYPNVSVFIPVAEVDDVSGEKPVPVGLANEIALSSVFADESVSSDGSSNIGHISINSLMDHSDFNVTGSVFKTKDFIEVGGLKSTIKMTFWFEFLLRMLYRGHGVYVVPKIGYIHSLGREGSLMLECEKMDKEEAEHWFEVAKQEYFFKEERQKPYENHRRKPTTSVVG